MADEKNTSMPEDVGVDVPAEQSSITEKLKAAAGNIDRHHADSKQRESTLIRESKEKAKEERLRVKESEKRNEDLEREAMFNAAAEREAFEEQRKLRKKLERERKRQLEEERRIQAEQKKAREESRAREVAEALEKEKADTEARKAKSAELVSRFSVTEEPEQEPEKAELPESVPTTEEPKAEEPAEDVTEAEEPKAEEIEEPKEPEAEEIEAEEETETEVREEYAPLEPGEDVPKADLDVSLHHGDGKYLVKLGNKPEENEKETGDFVIEINDEEEEIAEEPHHTVVVAEEPAPAPEKATQPEPEKKEERGIPKLRSGKIKASELDPDLDDVVLKPIHRPAQKGKSAPTRIKLDTPNLAEVDLLELIEVEPEPEVVERIPIEIYDIDEDSGKVVVDKPKEEEEIPPLTFDDDLITSIKKQGRAVHDRNSYKAYIKRSDKAIDKFYSDINRIDKNIEDADDENRIPPMIVDSISIMGKIVDIRSDNLAVTAKTQKKKVTDKFREALAHDIDNYNSRVAYFTKATGSKLTKLSAFLPDAIANGTGRPVIPVLRYVENYVEIFPDADGNLPTKDDNIATTVIAPVVSFEEEVGNSSPRNRDEAKDFIARVNKAKKELLAKINTTAKAIQKNAKAKRKNHEKEEGAFTARDADILECFENFSRKERRTKKYEKTIKAIDDRYRNVILEAREERSEKRYDEVDRDLYVERLTAERERVVFTLEAVRSLRGIVTPKELKAIVASVVREMQTYNALAKECGSRIGKELSKVSGALADEVMRTGEKYLFPLIIKRRELYERVGKNERLVGDAVREDYLKTTKAERLKRIREKFNFDKEKTISDRALMREDVRLHSIERLADLVIDKKTFRRLVHKCKYSFKEFKRTLKQTDKAIFRTRDRDGVIVAMTENLRVRSKYVASIAVALECATDHGFRKYVKKYKKLLDTEIERYNNRCVDYKIITKSKANQRRGWKLTQISSFLSENIAEGETSAVVPELSYREHYVECYPKTKETDNAYVDPAKRGCEYIPIDYNDRRYTENDMVEITVINSPISSAETLRSDEKATEPRQAWFARWPWYRLMHGRMFRYGLNDYLRRARKHKNKALRQEKKFNKKLDKLIKRYEKKTRNLNNKTPELLRESPKYVKKMSKLEAKYTRKSIKLRYRRVKRGIERRVLNYSVRELAIYREIVVARILAVMRVRSSANEAVIKDAKRDLVSDIREHNDIADALALILGKPIAKISTTIADQIINEGTEYHLPKIAICKETVESVGNESRTIGDPYRHGMPYTINSQGIAVITGTCAMAPGVAIKGIGLDADMKPIIGATHSGLSYAGTPNPKVLGIATKAKVATSRTHAGSNSPVFAADSTLFEMGDALFSDIDKKPVSAEIKEINNYLVGAISTRAGAVSSVFDYRHYTRRSRRVLRKITKVFRTNNKLFREYDNRVKDVFTDAIASNNLRGIRLSLKKNVGGNLTDKFRSKLDSTGASQLWKKIQKDWNKQRGNIAKVEKQEVRYLRKHKDIRSRLFIAPRDYGWETLEAPNVRAFHLLAKDLRKRRAKVFQLFEEVRFLEQYRYIFELRTLAALGKLIEIRCADLCAASKIQLTFGRQLKLWILGLRYNPRKVCRQKLEDAIEQYNDIHVCRAEEIIGRQNKYDLSLIDTMLPEGLANREYEPDVPALVYRDRFAEVVTAKVTTANAPEADREADEINYVQRAVDINIEEEGLEIHGKKNSVIEGVYLKQTARSDDEGDDEVGEKEVEVNLINSSIIPVVTDARKNDKYFRLEEEYNRAITQIRETRKMGIPKQAPADSMVLNRREFEKAIKILVGKSFEKLSDKLDDMIESKLRTANDYADKNEKFVKKKLFALHRYEKSVFRISWFTHKTALYQRLMSKRLKRFRNRLYKLRMKEIRFNINKGRVKLGTDAYEIRMPNMSLSELRSKCAVEAMLLERRRLILAVHLCAAVHGKRPNDSEFKQKSVLLSRARRLLTKAMLSYKTTTGECERILKTKKLWMPDMEWYKHVQVGEFKKAVDKIPRIVALRQLAEEYDRIKPIDQRARTIVIPSRRESGDK